MFVWPPIPLHPLDDGPDRKLAHSDRLAFPITIAPADLSRWTMNASAGVLPASAQEPAVVAMPVVLMLSLTMIGMPSSGRLIKPPRILVRCPRVREGRRADGDDGVENRVELADPVQVELRQLDGSQPVRIHQLLELRDRRRVDVDARDAGVRRFGREAGRRCHGAGHPEHQGQQGGRHCKGKSAAHRVTSTGLGGVDAGIARVGGDPRRGSYTHPAVRRLRLFRRLT